MAAASGLSCSAWPTPRSAFDLQGHRGARGLAPENTLAAFAKALEIGVTTLETDLAVTRDGVFVLSHDPVLNPDIVRGPDGKWLAAPGPAINTLTLAELKRFDVGRLKPAASMRGSSPTRRPSTAQRIPTLAELFELAETSGKPPRFNIETKLSPDKPEREPGPGHLRPPRGRGGARSAGSPAAPPSSRSTGARCWPRSSSRPRSRPSA